MTIFQVRARQERAAANEKDGYEVVETARRMYGLDTEDGRIAVRPFNVDECCVLRRLQIGISGGVGVENEPVAPNTLRTPATVPWFAYNATVRTDGTRFRLSPEVAYFYGPLGLAAQYYHQQQELRPSATGPSSAIIEDVSIDGFYVLATCFLTGEERIDYTQQIDPLHGEIMCGYQGWFRCPGDPANMGWIHWSCNRPLPWRGPDRPPSRPSSRAARSPLFLFSQHHGLSG